MSTTMLSAEVLIIGAGLAGSVIARRLAEAGVDVLCIEQGNYPDPADYPGERQEGELIALGPWHPNPNIRGSPSDYPIDETASDMRPMIFNGVGGGTILYGAQWMRFLPSDFRTYSTDGVGDDWPITYDELKPFYDRIDRAFGVSGVDGDPIASPHAPYPMPPLPITRVGQKLVSAHARLGWHCWPGSNAIASRAYNALQPCLQLGVCGSGCPARAKSSVDITHWPIAQSRGARLVTQARISRITHDQHGSANGALFRTRDGLEGKVSAPLVILAANAIGTPRILLSSASPKFPQGLGNGSGLVGKRLMMHPFSRAIGFFDEPMETWQGAWGQTLYSLEFANTRPNVGFVRGAKWNLGPTGGPLTAALFPWPEEPLWGEAMHRHVDTWLGRSAIWGLICEDLPEESNRVELDDGATDTDGNPGARLLYRLSENSRAMLAYNRERATESLIAAGAKHVVAPDILPDFGWHPLGTCRMGIDHSNSVTNRFGAVHDVPGLYIADSSVVVTGSCANPAATVAALALRTADHLIDNRGRL